MNIKNTLRKEGGFTIVELLIVVVVIAILAAITIVSYNGITTQANNSAAKANAASWQKKIELYQADKGHYPFTVADMSNATNSAEPWYIPKTSLDNATLTSETGKTKVTVLACGPTIPADQATTQGNRVIYFDFTTNAPTTTPINIGVTTACTTAAVFNP